MPGSPFAVAVSGQGSEKQREKIKHMREAVPVTEVGSQCRLTFKMPGISASDLDATVLAPSGKVNQCLNSFIQYVLESATRSSICIHFQVDKAAIAELEDGLYAVNFVPCEMGIHTVSVKYHDVDIPGSPFQFTVGPLQDGGAHKVG